MHDVYDEENPFYMEPQETVLVSSDGIAFYESEMLAYGWHIENESPKHVVIIIHKPIQKKRRRCILRTR